MGQVRAWLTALVLASALMGSLPACRYLGPQYYAFRILAVGQFRGRTFDCPTDTGASLTLCDGDNVLRSLNIPIGGVGVYFGEFIALIAGLWIFAAIALTVRFCQAAKQ